MVWDVVVIVLFLLILLYGKKKGFIGIAAKLIFAILAFAVAYFLAAPIGMYIENSTFGVRIKETINEVVLNTLEDSIQNDETTTLKEPKQNVETLVHQDLMQIIEVTMQEDLTQSAGTLTSQDVTQNVEGDLEQATPNKTQTLQMKISRYIFTGIGFVIVFVTVRLVLWIIQKILESVFELPILKTFNKAGGMFAAGLLYIVELSVILFVIKCFSTLNFMTSVVNAIDSTIITKFMYNYNIITWLIISKIF